MMINRILILIDTKLYVVEGYHLEYFNILIVCFLFFSEMEQKLINHKNYYRCRIEFLRLQIDHLLGEIYMLENQINQQSQHQSQSNVNLTHQMGQRVICMVAEIETCKHFHAINQVFSNMSYFNDIYTVYHDKILKNFIKEYCDEKQKLTKMKQLLMQNFQIDESDIDFTRH